MKTFTIDAEMNVTAYATLAQAKAAAGPEAAFFSDEASLDVAVRALGLTVTNVWNSLPGVASLAKITNRPNGLKRILRQLGNLEVTPVDEPKPAKANDAAETAHTPRHGSKQAQVVEMLRTPEGATLDAIMEATDWQRHTVRGFIAGTAQKKLGLKIESFKNDAGQRTYRVVAQGTPGPPGDPHHTRTRLHLRLRLRPPCHKPGYTLR
jgi:Protein of unknown function (DUF3489)